MIDKTLLWVFGHENFKTMGGSRTDAKVSANHYVFELFLDFKIDDLDAFLVEFNRNLPADIKGLKVEETNADFNIINTGKQKEYLYLFAFGQKAHPFSAPIMTTYMNPLDIDLMIRGAAIFKGTHDFIRYCTQPKENTKTIRHIDVSEIIVNTDYQANFFPENSYIFRVVGKGFLRYQVRLMMGQLVRLGRHEINLKDLEDSLSGENRNAFDTIAPQSGLILNEVRF